MNSYVFGDKSFFISVNRSEWKSWKINSHWNRLFQWDVKNVVLLTNNDSKQTFVMAKFFTIKAWNEIFKLYITYLEFSI